ncbi:MAG: outer membrane lipoprotein chaperone LolA [OM182 bacterium]|jgi:outer membrane lipoprotein carrier protein|nr:outer membrane lipoprotein chaperone LolA [OM182 bacterium]
MMPASLCAFFAAAKRFFAAQLLVLFGLVYAHAAEVSPANALSANLAEMMSLSADVEQLIIEADGGVLEESRIRMLLKRPDGFSWETLEPFPELLVTNGIWLWNYQPDLDQVVIEPWNRDESELAAQLLGGETDALADEYEIAVLTSESRDIAEFILTPRESANINRRVSLSFASNRLDSIVIEARNGQRTVWRFVNVVLNPEIPDEAFEFKVPEGIEVIENSYAERL